jgi:hypothetical protein
LRKREYRQEALSKSRAKGRGISGSLTLLTNLAISRREEAALLGNGVVSKVFDGTAFGESD